MEERGGEWGKAKTQGLHWHILSWARLRAIKAGASPSLSFHPHRPVAAVSCVRFLVSAGLWHGSLNLPNASILDVHRYPLSEAGDLESRGEARRRLDRAVVCVSSQLLLLSSCSLTCCLLLIIILFLYLSLQRHAHSLLLHGNHLLVSLSCSAASVIHNIPPCITPLSAALGWMQQSKRASFVSASVLFTSHPGFFFFFGLTLK